MFQSATKKKKRKSLNNESDTITEFHMEKEVKELELSPDFKVRQANSIGPDILGTSRN